MGGDICVMGSLNMDLVIETLRVPHSGETIISKSFNQIPGGKGANQAYAVGKLGGKVKMIGACGLDSYGDKLLKNLQSGGVNIDNVYRLHDTTGVALITVEENGENRIMLVPGANFQVTPGKIDQKSKIIESASYLLLQLEVPVESVVRAIEIARNKTKVILDPSPVRKIPERVYQNIDYILPNEGELDLLISSYKLKSEKEKTDQLLELGVGAVIVTKGSRGIAFYSKDIYKTYQRLRVEAVDTTAAGDAFAGAFVFGLQQDWTEEEAIKFAIKVAGVSVTKLGAQTSIPDYQEVEKFLGNKEII